MNFSGFFNGFFGFLDKLPSWQGITTLIIVLLLFILAPQIRKLSVWLFEKFVSKRRSCVECVHVLCAFSEKYKTQADFVQRRILETQLNFAEQKIDAIILNLLRTYKDDQQKMIEEKDLKVDSNTLDKEYIHYKECLANAFELAKREIRRSFKENGFEDLSGKDFADYVKGKMGDLLAITQSYVMNAYFKDSVVPIEYRFKNFDERAFEDIAFEIYMKAKEIKKESKMKLDKLQEEFKKEIDDFIKDKV